MKSNTGNNGLSIIIPAYNEENAILETIEHIHEVLNPSDIQFEIVVVNDGSKDGTLSILDDLQNSTNSINEFLTVYSHQKNKGYGASLKTGIGKAAYESICITDADGTYPNKRIPELYGKYKDNHYDMIVGKRDFKALPSITRPAKWFITKLANFLVEGKIPDINSGLRVFKKEIAVSFFPIICDGFSFTTTITLSMFSNNYDVHYEPIEYFKRKGKSKIKPVKDTLNFIQLIIRTVTYFNPLKVFVPFSILLFFLSVFCFVLGRLGIFFAETPNDTITVLFVGAMQILATGIIADMLSKFRIKN